ncbi:sugar phosphate isomerase/epimerase family protein [Deinococcus sp.]|uniref:sugar phosphate isomerase/epimerase family protein n=1 Tax=Deinococcus sp. TaxID=47478 RepID=UPI003B5C7181
MVSPVGLQLYTLRDQLAEDFGGTLEAVAKLGIRDVELAGIYGGMDAAALKAFLSERGLRAVSAHIGGEALTADAPGQIAFLKALGIKHAVYPWFKAEGEQAWVELAEQLERWAQQFAAEGLTFSYHNHDHELSGQAGGQPILDMLLTRAPSLSLELDTAWVYAGGHDPVAYLERYASRTPLVHLKDLRREGDGWRTVELGSGDVPLEAILGAIPSGANVFYEQDQANGLTSVRESLAYLAGL